LDSRDSFTKNLLVVHMKLWRRIFLWNYRYGPLYESLNKPWIIVSNLWQPI